MDAHTRHHAVITVLGLLMLVAAARAVEPQLAEIGRESGYQLSVCAACQGPFADVRFAIAHAGRRFDLCSERCRDAATTKPEEIAAAAAALVARLEREQAIADARAAHERSQKQKTRLEPPVGDGDLPYPLAGCLACGAAFGDAKSVHAFRHRHRWIRVHFACVKRFWDKPDEHLSRLRKAAQAAGQPTDPPTFIATREEMLARTTSDGARDYPLDVCLHCSRVLVRSACVSDRIGEQWIDACSRPCLDAILGDRDGSSKRLAAMTTDDALLRW